LTEREHHLPLNIFVIALSGICWAIIFWCY
jgi:hypothetical protein